MIISTSAFVVLTTAFKCRRTFFLSNRFCWAVFGITPSELGGIIYDADVSEEFMREFSAIFAFNHPSIRATKISFEIRKLDKC